jgi:hypothetical protein
VLHRPDPARVERGLQHARSFDWAQVGPRVAGVYQDLLGIGHEAVAYEEGSLAN